jgi:DNA invertase Pin-like site-specific DNA recombinase
MLVLCCGNPLHTQQRPLHGMKHEESMTKFVAYHRVSTQKQGRSGLGLEAQKASIVEYIRTVNGVLCAEFTEVETGKRKDRPELGAALAQCRLQGATLIVAKLDRLARNVAFVSNLMESGCEFCAADFPQANRFMIHLLAAVGEYEAKLISDRTKAALQSARRRGVNLGGNRGNILEVQRKGSRMGNEVRSAKAQQRANDLRPLIAEIQANGSGSLREIAAQLNARGIQTARGGEWSPTAVMRVLA